MRDLVTLCFCLCVYAWMHVWTSPASRFLEYSAAKNDRDKDQENYMRVLLDEVDNSVVAVSFAFGASIRAALTDALLPQIAIDATFLQPAHAVDTVVEMVRIILSHASFTLWLPFLL